MNIADLKNVPADDAVSEFYTNYSKYVIATRAYPSLVDGCKAIHRRIIEGCTYNLPRRKIKSANAVGEVTKLHPHPSAIYPVLVSMASSFDCAFPLFDTKGNFGGMNTEPAAERYTELMISNLAIKIFESFGKYTKQIQGEMDNKEPENLATFLPLCFLHGSYGIPVGMNMMNIPALNPIDMINYCIEVLKSGDLDYRPNVLVKPNMGGIQVKNSKKDWQNLLNKGEGKITYLPRIEVDESNKQVIATCVPEGRTIEHVMKVFKNELDRDQLDIRDETTSKYRFVVEILPYKKVSIQTVKEKMLKALTKNESYRFIFAYNGVAVYAGFHEVIKNCLSYLKECCEKWIDNEIENLSYKITILEIIEQMKKDGSVSKLSTMNREQAIKYIMKTYEALEEQAKSVLSKPLSYLTKEHLSEIKDLKNMYKIFKQRKSDINSYLIERYEELIPEVREVLKQKELTTFANIRTKRSLLNQA